MDNLFEKYGGESFWLRLLDEFYDKNIQDDLLKPFFEGKDVLSIKRMNTSLLTSALKASTDYSLVQVKQLHMKFGIKQSHFNRFLLNIYHVMQSCGVAEEDIEYILVVIEAFKEDIIS